METDFDIRYPNLKGVTAVDTSLILSTHGCLSLCDSGTLSLCNSVANKFSESAHFGPFGNNLF